MSADEAPSDLILNPLRLIVRETENAGRGVFAPADIPAGSVLEEAPVLVLTKEEWETGKLNDGVLGGYAFNWSGGGMAVALGIGMLNGIDAARSSPGPALSMHVQSLVIPKCQLHAADVHED